MPRKSTRAAQGGGSIRKRPDGRWEARYTVGRDPGTGKQIQKSVYGETQAEVRKKLQQVTTAIDEGVFTEPARLTVGAWLEVWITEYVAEAVKETTHALYARLIRKTITPALGAIRLQALTAPAIQKFYNCLQRDNGLSPKSIKNLHGVFHKALSQAVELGYIRVNPSDACTLPRVEKPSIKPLEGEEIGRFLEAIKGNEYERVFIVDLFTGLRQSELIGMTWDCVNFERGVIHIYRQLQLINGEYKFTSLKNDKPRHITPARYVMETLREQKRLQAEWRLQAGPAWQDGGFVFTNRIGDHMKRQTLYRAFKNAARDVGVPDARFHDMRHTFAVLALQSGDDVKTVQENLGHHTAAFTLDVYGHVTEQMRKESAARMDRMIQNYQPL